MIKYFPTTNKKLHEFGKLLLILGATFLLLDCKILYTNYKVLLSHQTNTAYCKNSCNLVVRKYYGIMHTPDFKRVFNFFFCSVLVSNAVELH